MPHNKAEQDAAAAVAATAASLKDRATGAVDVLRGKTAPPVQSAAVNFEAGILGVAQGTVDAATLRETLDADLNKLFKSTRSAAKGNRSARGQVVVHIREFAAKLTGKTPDQIPKLGLKNVRRGLIEAVKKGATKNQVGAATAILLQRHLGDKLFRPTGPLAEGVVARGRRSLTAGGAGRGRLTAAVAAGGKPPGRLAKFALTPGLGRLAAGIAGFFALDAVAGRIGSARQDKAALQKMLREGAGLEDPIVSPDTFINFLGDQGPEFNQAVRSNPELAVALFDRLQSMAGARIPTGSAVLRTSRAEGVSADSLISELQGGQ